MAPKKATPRSVSPPLSPRRSSRKSAVPPVSPVPLPPSPKPRASKPVKEAGSKKVAGWHSTTGGAPSIRGNTQLARFAALFGVFALIMLTGPTAFVKCVPSARESSAGRGRVWGASRPRRRRRLF